MISFQTVPSRAEPVPSPAAPAAPIATSNTPASSTGFAPVPPGAAETRDGGTLMVEAYAVIWTILMVWLFAMWNKQRNLNERLGELEGALDRAEAKGKKKDAA